MQKGVAVQLGVGGAIIMLGVVILVDLFVRFIDIEILLAWGPVVFLLIGFLLVSSPQTKTLWVGVAILLAGALVVFDRMDLMTPGFRPIIILTGLLLAGLAIVSPVVVRKDS